MKKKIQRILLLGASSQIGKSFWKRLEGTNAVGTYGSHAIARGIRYDVRNDALDRVIKNLERFTHAIILLGETNPDRCAQDLERSEDINVVSMKRLVDTLVRFRIHCTFASSEFVFDGTRGNWKETDQPRPILTYGRQKRDIEKYLSATTRDHVIVRFGKVYGSHKGDHTLFTSWIEQLLAGRPVTVATDQLFSPIWVEDVISSVLLLIERQATGVFHVAGPRGFSRKALFEMTVETLSRKKQIRPRVKYCSIDDFPLIEKRPHDVSLSIKKLIRTIGFRPHEPQEICKRIVGNLNI